MPRCAGISAVSSCNMSCSMVRGHLLQSQIACQESSMQWWGKDASARELMPVGPVAVLSLFTLSPIL